MTVISKAINLIPGIDKISFQPSNNLNNVNVNPQINTNSDKTLHIADRTRLTARRRIMTPKKNFNPPTTSTPHKPNNLPHLPQTVTQTDMRPERKRVRFDPELSSIDEQSLTIQP